MMQTIERPMSLEEFDALPERNRPIQLIEGNLVVAPSPDRFHQRLSGAIYVAVYLHLEAYPDLGEVYQAPFDVQFPGVNVYQPDVMFFARAHLGRLTDKRAVGAPDLVVEVLSPSTARYDTGKKREVYARFGVTELWIVDPPAPQHQRLPFGPGPRPAAAGAEGQRRIKDGPIAGLCVAVEPSVWQ
jgi:Uma2 family endonuclease